MRELLKISWLDEQGVKKPWIVIGCDQKDGYYYHEHTPRYHYLKSAHTLADVIAYLWREVIDVDIPILIERI